MEGAQAAALEKDISGGGSETYRLEKEFINKAGLSVSVSGRASYGYTVNIKYYQALEHKFLSYKMDYYLYDNINVTGELEAKIPLGKLIVAPVPGVFAEFTPNFVIKVSGEVEFSTGVKEHSWGLLMTAIPDCRISAAGLSPMTK